MHFVVLILAMVLVSCNNPKTAEVTLKTTSLNFDSLLNSKDTNQVIITIDSSINALITSDDDFNRLSGPQKIFLCIQELEREVNNGGFNQYFYNSSGDHAHETILALNTIEAINVKKLLQSAIDEFPDHQVPKDRIIRQKLLSQIEDKAQKNWDRLDNEFYKYPDDLNKLSIIYVRKNQEEFER